MNTGLVIATLLIMLAAYCICGIPFGLIFSSRKGVDVRTKGSGNIGTTNVAREVGGGTAALTLLCDAGKGFISTWLGGWILAELFFGGDPSLLAPDAAYGWCMGCIFLACICGHIFSPYLHFRGGKGIAVGFGAALGFSWPIALGLLMCWGLCMAPSRRVSVGSIASAVALPFLSFFIYYPVTWAFEVPMILIALIVAWAHRDNIKKLRDGNEAPMAFANGAKDQEDVLAPESATKAVAQDEAAKEAVAHTGDIPRDTPLEQEERAIVNVDATEAGPDSVAAVQEAAQEAAEKDAQSLPEAGKGLVFGDEEKVSEAVDDAAAALEKSAQAQEAQAQKIDEASAQEEAHVAKEMGGSSKDVR